MKEGKVKRQRGEEGGSQQMEKEGKGANISFVQRVRAWFGSIVKLQGEGHDALS